ncbi:SH3 domain-containing protein [Clostridium sp.]|uniref:SH3 domain-containing protein n=1 Tax=Clostridium sp. TaxID=1506 RepID=UPI003993E20C
MKKTQLSSLLLGLGLIGSIGLGVANVQSSSASTNVKNVRLLVNSRHACVINGNGNLSLTNKSGQIIGYVSVGEMLTLGESSNGKTFVTVQETGETGYLANSNIKDITSGIGKDFTKINEQGYVINVTTLVHVRANATMDSQILSSLSNNTTLTITGKMGNWYKIDVNGVKGYIFDEYITKTSNIQNNTKTTSNSNSTKITSTSTKNKTTTNSSSINNTNSENNKENSTAQKASKESTPSHKTVTESGTTQKQHRTTTKDNNNSQTFSGNGIVKKLGTGYYHAKLHSAPSSSSSGYDLTPGTQVQILGETNEFYHVKLTDGEVGYIYAPYVERVN